MAPVWHGDMIAIDHLVITAPDANHLGAELEERTGLAAVAGGRHTGHGTGNRLVPLGDAYLELLEVIDRTEAQTSPFGRWVLDRPQHGLGLVCLRTGDADAVAARLDREPVAMSRVTTDGTELRWRLVGLDDALGPARLPFFIQWELAGAPHPGAMRAGHRVDPVGITALELGGDPARVQRWVGDHDLPIRFVGGPPGPRSVTVATSRGPFQLTPTGLA